VFPYKDENPTYTTPVVTVGLILVNIVVWVTLQGMGQDELLKASVCRLGFIPGNLFGDIPANAEILIGEGETCRIGSLPGWATVVTSMFMHGGWMHLIGNLWFLWVFGNNIEDSTGHLRFLVFYLLCGAVAALAEGAAEPASVVPMVGASGAISGVMGGYIVLYPRVRVHMIVFLFVFITRIVVPAFLMLGYWFLLQLLSHLARDPSKTGGTAFLAHAAGFIAGMVLILMFRNRGLVARRSRVAWQDR
jgi:membrane associated rhomboid family serine protease